MIQNKDIPVRGLDKAYDAMKHIATLCTGVITLTVTFADKFKVAGTDLAVPDQLKWAWLLFIISLIASLWAILAVTGTINEVDTKGKSSDAMSSNIRIPAVISLIAFAGAIVCTAIAGKMIVG